MARITNAQNVIVSDDVSARIYALDGIKKPSADDVRESECLMELKGLADFTDWDFRAEMIRDSHLAEYLADKGESVKEWKRGARSFRWGGVRYWAQRYWG